MKKRSKVRIPVTQGLKDVYAMDMHLPYQSACAGQFNVVAFSRLAAAISVVRTALDQTGKGSPEAVAALDQAVETLLEIRHRGDGGGVWEINETERPVVLAGIQAAEECIGILSVDRLQAAADTLLMQLANEPAAA
jgi:hypothetical protein